MSYKKKLIEIALPLDVINRESAREKSIRYGHPSTLHLWWARRPLAAARAVLFASLVDDPSSSPDRFPTTEEQDVERQRLFRIIEELVKWENINDPRVLSDARREIVASVGDQPPAVLDPFCGGGTIPVEAQRLGILGIGGDLNPVAVLISKAMVELPTRFSGVAPVSPHDEGSSRQLDTWSRAEGLAEDVQHYGNWLHAVHESESVLGIPTWIFPWSMVEAERTVVVWLWARTVTSPDPAWDGQVPLVKSWVLSDRRGSVQVWVEPIVDTATQSVSYRIRSDGSPPEGTVSRTGGVCIATGSPIPFEYVRAQANAGHLGKQMIAIVAQHDGKRIFLEPADEHIAASEVPVPDRLPTGSLPEKGLGFRVQNYGFRQWHQLFTERQLAALVELSSLLPEVRLRVLRDAANKLPEDDRPLRFGGRGPAAYADAVLTYLAFGIDRLADISNAMCRWESSRTQVRNLFARQAISMVWDFAETNLFGDAAGDFGVSLGSIVRTLQQLPAGRPEGQIEQRDARARVRESGRPLVSTDPPYYDNIGYSDLSDFFYVWLRHNLADVWPDELSTLLTPKAEELIADPGRHDSRRAADEHFETGMKELFREIAENADPRFPVTAFYAFKQTESDAQGTASTGWEVFLEGVLGAGLSIESTWPIRTEMTGGLRNLGRNSLASSVVISCRPRGQAAPLATRSELIAALRRDLPASIHLLQQEAIAPVDLAQSAIGPGMAVFSRYQKVIEADGSQTTVRQALSLINEVLQEVLSAEETEFDGDTRWALTWFEQHGLDAGPYGDAETLSKAKNTSVGGVVRSGIAVQRDGQVRLLARHELSTDWDPADDSRLTVWEVTQQLIVRLGESEMAAADLLQRVGGGLGERSRQLAYLLFQMADRRGWAEEAVAYNGLIQAWTYVSELVTTRAVPVQPTLGE